MVFTPRSWRVWVIPSSVHRRQTPDRLDEKLAIETITRQDRRFNEYYDGCYISYPDVEMLQYAYWPELYDGNKGLVPFLQQVKKKYDPNNVFHHAMSIRA